MENIYQKKKKQPQVQFRNIFGPLLYSSYTDAPQEQEQFLKVATSQSAQGHIHIFFARRACTKVPGASRCLCCLYLSLDLYLYSCE